MESLCATLSFPSTTSSTGWTNGYAKTLLLVEAPSLGGILDEGVEGKGAEQKESVEEGKVAGMALYFHNYSTWRSAPGIYLEDLFVRPECRGRGYGKALIAKLAKECLRLGCKRLDWSVLNWNKPSIDFYLSEDVGAKIMDEWLMVRVDGEKLAALAS